MRLILTLSALAVAGCAAPPTPPSKLVKPAAALMVDPERLPDLHAGDDIGVHAMKVRKMYGHETSKLRRLQRWVRTVTK